MDKYEFDEKTPRITTEHKLAKYIKVYDLRTNTKLKYVQEIIIGGELHAIQGHSDDDGIIITKVGKYTGVLTKVVFCRIKVETPYREELIKEFPELEQFIID